ncbi:MAG: hypothetical protein WKG07_36325 [Hymenobacter sp.]
MFAAHRGQLKLTLRSMSNNILAGKVGIISGALNSQSIAWKVAQKAHAEGARYCAHQRPAGHAHGRNQDAGR